MIKMIAGPTTTYGQPHTRTMIFGRQSVKCDSDRILNTRSATSLSGAQGMPGMPQSGYVSRPIPAGGGDFLFGQFPDIELCTELVQDRGQAKLLPVHSRGAGASAHESRPCELNEKFVATTEVLFVAEVEFAATIARAPRTIRQIRRAASSVPPLHL